MKRIIIISLLAIIGFVGCGEDVSHEDERCYLSEDLENSYLVTYTKITETCGLNKPAEHNLLVGEYTPMSGCTDQRVESEDSCTVTWKRNCARADFVGASSSMVKFDIQDDVTVPLYGIMSYVFKNSVRECHGSWEMNFVEP